MVTRCGHLLCDTIGLYGAGRHRHQHHCRPLSAVYRRQPMSCVARVSVRACEANAPLQFRTPNGRAFKYQNTENIPLCKYIFASYAIATTMTIIFHSLSVGSFFSPPAVHVCVRVCHTALYLYIQTRRSMGGSSSCVTCVSSENVVSRPFASVCAL